MRAEPTLRAEWRYLVAAALGPFCLYLITMPVTVTFEDCGQFILVAKYLGIAHPPGYPLWSWLAKACTFIPVGTIAYRVHLCSAIFGALSCGALYFCGRHLFQFRSTAMLAAYAFGLSRVFWSQAIVAEVYTLNTFFFFTLLAGCLRYSEKPSLRLLLLGSFWWGLGLSNHIHLLMLSTPCLLILMLGQWRHFLKYILLCIPCAALGLFPYAVMYFRSHSDVPINFFGPIDGIEALVRYVLRLDIHATDTSPSAGWADKQQYGSFLIREILTQFSYIGAAFAIFGVIGQWRRWPARVCLALTLGFLGTTALLWWLLTFDYELAWQTSFRVYPLIAYGILALWVASGLEQFLEWRFRGENLGAAPVIGFSIGLVMVLVGMHLPQNSRRDDRWAHEYGMQMIQMTEPDAVLMTNPDLDYGPVGYLLMIEHVRDDVTLYNGRGMVFANRLYDWTAPKEQQDAAWVDFVFDHPDTPFYYTGPLEHAFGVEDHGLLRRVRPDLGRSMQATVTPTESLLDFTKRYAEAERFHDGWSVLMRDDVARHMARYLVRFDAARPEHLLTYKISQTLDALGRLASGMTGKAEAYYELNRMEEARDAALDAIEKMNNNTQKFDRAHARDILGRALLALGDTKAAIATFADAVDAWPTLQNAAVVMLIQALAQDNRLPEAAHVVARFAHHPGHEHLETFLTRLRNHND